MNPNKQVQQAKQRHLPPPPERRRCCATCDNLLDTGLCKAYQAWPPIHFIEQENDCEQYEETPPF